ncbi:MAG: hypothetical protein LKF68_04350 [Prevotella sp.]|nr:hypothetical protein [Prevotella sp.]MCH4216008.1 hypothetical protein [Prevotella sp.]
MSLFLLSRQALCTIEDLSMHHPAPLYAPLRSTQCTIQDFSMYPPAPS